MHEALLAAAVLPAPVVILRLPLQPYSLGHELRLHRAGNPFVTLAENDFNALTCEQQIAALVEAVDICSQTWAQNEFTPRTPWQRWRVNRVWKKWRNLIRNSDWPVEIAEFRNYRTAGSLAFESELPRDAGPARFLGAPELLILHRFIVQHLSATKCVWDFPLGLARMMKQTDDEQEGRLEIYNYRDAVHDEYVRQREAEEAAKASLKAETGKGAS